MTKDKRKYSDRAEYLKKAVDKRRRKIRQMSIDIKGGKCQICWYNKCTKALEFHHKDPNKKDFGLSAKGYTRSWAKIKQEIKKCVLICANCHREVHEGISSLPE